MLLEKRVYPVLSRRDARGRTLLHYAVGQLKHAVVGECMHAAVMCCWYGRNLGAINLLTIHLRVVHSYAVHTESSHPRLGVATEQGSYRL